MNFRNVLGAGVAVAALVASSASAMTINLVDLGGVTGSQSEQGFKIAAAFWANTLTNNATINLGVKFAPLAPNVIGSTGSRSIDYTVANWETRVNATKSNSAVDTNIVLPTLTNGAISAIVSGPGDAATGFGVDTAIGNRVYDNNQSVNNKTLYLNTSVVKAIGGAVTGNTCTAASTAGCDGRVTFSSTFGFDFNPTDGITENTFDFIGVAIHEIGHALGFVSGVDYYDYDGKPNGPGVAGGLTYDFNDTSLFSALDMFRYSNDPTNLVPGTAPVLDLSVGSNSYFSLDGGVTNYGGGFFSTGAYNGDGRQASHWKDASGANRCGPQLGIMDPTFCFAQTGEVTSLDLAAFDAIGYNIVAAPLQGNGLTGSIFNRYGGQFGAATVPEPASWAMLITGFGLIGSVMRRRASRVSFG